MSLLKVNEIQIFNGTTVTITATTTETSADLNVGADLDVTGALTLGTALAIAEGGTGATDAATARTNLDVDQAGTDNSTDVSLVTTSHDYLSITGQSITLGAIDLAADVIGTLATSNGGTGVTALSSLDAANLGSAAATDGYVLTADGAGGAAWEAKSPIDLLSSGASIRKSDGTTAVLSESGGAVKLENVSLGDTVLMPDNSNNVSTAPGIRFEADTDTGIGLASAGNLAIVTGGSERMRIDSSGSVCINCTSLADVQSGGIAFAPSGGNCDMIVGSTTTNSDFVIRFFNPNGNVGNIGMNGSATYYNTSSDYRLKEDLQPIADAIDRLKALNPVNFAWKVDGSRVDGFIAHEAQEVVPEAVTGTKDAVNEDGNPEYQGIDYGRITPLLTAALQEAVSKIEMLEKRIAQLEAK